jgi:hypothetical protein
MPVNEETIGLSGTLFQGRKLTIFSYFAENLHENGSKLSSLCRILSFHLKSKSINKPPLLQKWT